MSGLKRLLALAMIPLLAAIPASAQDFPTGPITIVVPFPAGGQQDIEARGLAESMSARLGQAVIVENRPGAGSAIGIGHVARSAPDGHTILVTGAGAAILQLISKDLAFNPTTDIVPVSQIAQGFILVTAPAQVGVKTWGEFEDLARSQPGQMKYASVGASSIMLAMEGLRSAAGDLPIIDIPYKGAADYYVAALRNDVQLFMSAYGEMRDYIDTGKFVPLLTLGDTKHPVLADLPTTAEIGYGDSVRNFSWTGVFVPAGTPQAIIDTIYGEVAHYVELDSTKERSAVAGTKLIGSTPAEFKAFIDEDVAAWTAVAKKINLTPQ